MKNTVICTEALKGLFTAHQDVDEVMVFDKRWLWQKKMRFSFSLRHKFDIFVDFKNSFLPVIAASKIRTPFIRPKKKIHAYLRYLELVKKVAPQPAKRKSRIIAPNPKKWDFLSSREYLFINGESNSQEKMYPEDKFKEVIETLSLRFKIVLIGQGKYPFWKKYSHKNVVNLSGKTEIADLFYLLDKYAKIMLSIDSAPLHIASYLNIPTLALFGPTDSRVYGPFSDAARVISKGSFSLGDIAAEEVISGIYELSQSLPR